MIRDLEMAKKDSSWLGWRDSAGLVAAVSCEGEMEMRWVKHGNV